LVNHDKLAYAGNLENMSSLQGNHLHFVVRGKISDHTLVERLLDYANKAAFRFLHVSTYDVYVSLAKEDAVFAQTNRYEPYSPYSASKATSDNLASALHHTYGLPVLTTNCSSNFGHYHFPEKLIPLIIATVLAGKSLPICVDGLQILNWLFVKDHCSTIRRVLEASQLG
jgi:dTDP-glucose 4,6-dehydratase